MSDTANWFARHLGLPQQQYQQPAPPPQQYQQPQQPQQWQQQPQQPAQQPPPPPMEVDANGNPVVHAMQAAAAWQGTRAAQADAGICPECGSGNYFKREDPKMMKKRLRNGAHPSPICMDCGYNELFENQYGAATPVDDKAPIAGTSPLVDTWNRT